MRRSLFWLAASVVAWTYVVFPAVVLLRARLRPQPVRVGSVTPRLSVVIAAHNEAAVIEAKLRSTLETDYPADRLQIIVASDGSTDGTADAARAIGGGVLVLDLPRCGKAAALNAALDCATGEIVVFTDANSILDRGALRALVAPFADPAVGGVAGDQRYIDGPPGAATGERQYWNLDRALKRAESAAGSVISATGALYAVRRSLVEPVPPGVTDDFVTSTRVVAKHYRLVFEPDAVAIEPVASTEREEFGRKVRIMTRGLRGVFVMRELLDPRRHGFYAVQLFSHKVLRRLVAIPVVVLAIVSPTLWRHGRTYRVAAAAQAGAWAAAGIGLAAPNGTIGRARIFALARFFALANAAALAATWNLVRGRRIDRWDPSPRRSSARGRRAEISGARPTIAEIRDRLDHVRGSGAPDLSIVVPVNAQGDLDNVITLLSDIARYSGPVSFDVILVVNNFEQNARPTDAIERLAAAGATVVDIPNARRHGEAPPFSARIPGVRQSAAPVVVLFDADCRIPDPTALINWYAAVLGRGVAAAYTNVEYYDLRPVLSVRARMIAHRGSRWVKRIVLGIPTIRGSNYGVNRRLFLDLYDRGMMAEDMNVGPVMRRFGGPVPYSGSPELVVLTSGRMFRGGWRRLGRYLVYRLRSNLRVLPVRPDAAQYTGRENEPVRRYVDNEPVPAGPDGR